MKKSQIKNLFNIERLDIRDIHITRLKKFNKFDVAVISSSIFDPYRKSKGMVTVCWILFAYPNFDEFKKLKISERVYRLTENAIKDIEDNMENVKQYMKLQDFEVGSNLPAPPTEKDGLWIIREDNLITYKKAKTLNLI